MESKFVFQESPRIEVYMNDQLREHKTYTLALNQLADASSLRGTVEPIIGMPDICFSYGLPVGSILATDAETGDISLRAIGNDINCGFSLSQTSLPKDAFIQDGKFSLHLANSLNRIIKLSMNQNRQRISREEIHDIFVNGALSIDEKEANRVENNGHYEINNSALINNQMLEVASKQLGTLGSGNHFIDLLVCKEVYDEERGVLWGINPDNLSTLLHSGSRGVGSSISNLYSKPGEFETRVYRTFQPRRFNSAKGKELFEAFHLASNFAFANRAVLRKSLETSLSALFGDKISLDLIYDISHNSISLEEQAGRKVVVHRKGASRAFSESQVSDNFYSLTGSPIIIPGTLGTDTYLLVATDKISETFNSIAHGAGRKYSRGYVASKRNHSRFRANTSDVYVNLSFAGYIEEAPVAYKDIEQVISTLEDAGLVKKVARFKPIYVYLERDK
jgi:tRNA-splicing ligase RtcB